MKKQLSNKTIAERLNHIAALTEAIPHKNFDLTSWHMIKRQGRKAGVRMFDVTPDNFKQMIEDDKIAVCAIGAAVFNKRVNQWGLIIEDGHIVERSGRSTNAWDAITNTLGIRTSEALELFSCASYGERVRPSTVARRVRKLANQYLEKGK